MISDVERDFRALPIRVRMSIVTALQAAIAAPTHFLNPNEAHDVLVSIGYPESAKAAQSIGYGKS